MTTREIAPNIREYTMNKTVLVIESTYKNSDTLRSIIAEIIRDSQRTPSARMDEGGQ